MAGKKHSQPAMMRIAIAGAGGFGYILAQEISQGANAVLVLSTREHPEIEENLNVQVAVVDYGSVRDLRYTLQGVDLLISTIGGNEQLNLIDAARSAGVRVFVPSEFEGALSHRPATRDPLDRGTNTVIEQLQRWLQSRSHRMAYTVFSCGIFYERMAPGGLNTYNIGHGQPGGTPGQGDFFVDVETATAEIVETSSNGHAVRVSMTSVYDVARFVAAAIELGTATWPREFKMRGDQMTALDIVTTCSNVRGVPFGLVNHPYASLEANLTYHEEAQDWGRWYYFQRLEAAASGRYHFRQANLNEAVNVRPVGFRAWLEQVWGPA